MRFELSKYYPKLCIILLIIIPFKIFSDSSIETSLENINVNQLNPKNNSENVPIVVSATKTKTKISKTPSHTTLINQTDISKKNYPSTDKLIEGEANIQVRQSGIGQNSPAIRGMSGYRTLLCIDGIRLNNPITRASSNNWVGTIDPFIIDRIEIVRGPMSVLYGSDALGGIVNYITQSPKNLEKDQLLETTIKGLYYSPSRSYSGHTDILTNVGNLYFIGGGTYGYAGDLRTADNEPQKPSSYHWWAGNGNLLYNLSSNSTLNLVFQAHLNYDVQEYNKSGPSENNFTSYQNYRPILDRELTYIRYTILNQRFFEEIMLTLSFQRLHEQKKDYKWNILPSPNHEISLLDNEVNSYGLMLKLTNTFSKIKLTYGADIYYEYINSIEKWTDFETGLEVKSEDVRGEFMNDSTYKTYSVFVQGEYELTKAINIIVGCRATITDIFTPLGRTSTATSTSYDIDKQIWNVCGNIGLVFEPVTGYVFKASGSQGFRPPNIEDLTANRRLVGAYWFEGNRELKPEQTYTGELGFIAYNSNRYNVGITGYYTRAYNLFEYNYVPTSPYKLSKYNVSAELIGGELFYKIIPFSTLSFYGNCGYTRGQDLTNHSPLMGISPFTGLHGISYGMFKPLNIELRSWIRWSNERTRLSLAENNSGVKDTDSWCTVNAGLVYYMNDKTKVYLTGENITDKHYTVYRLIDSRNRDNYLWAPGIGISIGFEFIF